MQMVLEAVISTRESLTAQLTALEARLSDRIGVLERAVRQNSADIKQLREEVAGLRHDFDRRADLARVDALEQRVARMEAKLGIAF